MALLKPTEFDALRRLLAAWDNADARGLTRIATRGRDRARVSRRAARALEKLTAVTAASPSGIGGDPSPYLDEP